MANQLETWQFIAQRLSLDEPVTLLVVAESSGSTPGRQGFKMAVAEDELCGSIGGGVMEVALVEDSRLKIQNSEETPLIREQVHRKDVANSSGMICSGKQTVVVKRLTTKELPAIQEIISVVENNQDRNLRITNNELRIANSENPGFNFERIGENGFLYEERLGFKNKLFIIGGGHCALALSELMSKMDFHITLFDDRSDLNTLAKNDFVHEKKIIGSYEGIGEHIESGENVYVVVMTLGFKFDETVVRKLFDKNFKYFGVLGSKAKMAVLLKDLENDGFDIERLDRIHTPIGVEINSRTPEEIAVSIAAEIIAVKNAKG